MRYPPGEWSAATDHADVRLGENRFTGDLHRYRIQAAVEEISVDVGGVTNGCETAKIDVVPNRER